MKKLLILILFLFCGINLYAEFLGETTTYQTGKFTKLNADQANISSATFTGIITTSDGTFFISTNAFAGSGAYDTQINALGLSTGTINSDLQISKTNILNSTNTLRTDLTTETNNRISSDNSIGVATATIRSDLTTETTNRQTGDNNLGVSTGTINNLVNTLQSWATAYYALNSPGGSGDAVLSSTQTFTGSNTFNNYTTISSTLNINSGKLFVGSNGNVGIGITNPTGFLQVSTGTNVCSIYVSTNGKVGIGNSNPSYLLDIKGTVRITDTSGSDGNIFVATALQIYNPVYASTKFRLLPYNNDIYFQNTNSAGNILFTGNIGDNLTGNVIFKGTGNVGFGTTNPTGKLQISTGTNSTSLFVSSTGCKVGIGTSTPTQTLDVNGQLTTNDYAIRTSSAIIGVSRIEWADGTVQISSGSGGTGGGGDVYLASSQTFTGENTLTKVNVSTMQIGGTPALSGYTLSNTGMSLFENTIYSRSPNGMIFSSGGVTNILAINSPADGTQNTNLTIPDSATMFIKNASDNDQLTFSTKGSLAFSSATFTGTLTGTINASQLNSQSASYYANYYRNNLPVYSVKLDTYSFCRIDAGENNWRLIFSSSTAKNGTWEGIITDDYSGGTLYADVYFSMTSTNTTSVSWNGYVMAMTSGDSADINTLSYDTVNTTSTINVPTTVGYMKKCTITLTNRDNIAAGDWYKFKLERAVEDAGDTSISDAEVIGIYLRE